MPLCYFICYLIFGTLWMHKLPAEEALGAIVLETNTSLKSSLVSDPVQDVRETCELALSRIEELKSVQNTK